MSNKSVCSTRLTAGAVRYSYKERAFFTVSGPGPYNLLRLRHYDDTAKAAPAAFNRSGLAVAIVPIEFASEETLRAALLEMLTLVVDSSAIGIFSTAEEIVEDYTPGRGVVLARTQDYRRAATTRLPSGRSLTAEGGAGYVRTPAEELEVTLHADRSSDAFYETAGERSARRRELVSSVVGSDPGKVGEILSSLKRSRVRVPAIMLAVDAAMCGAPNAARNLSMVLERPDDPSTALKYLREAYPDAKIPTSVKRALGEAATRLYDESACIRFDVERRRGVEDRAVESRPASFRDVLMVARPAPGSARQSELFAAILSGYTKVEKLPILSARRELKNLEPEDAARAIAAAAQRVTEARRAGERIQEPLSSLPWSELVALSAGPRPDLVLLSAAGERIAASLKALYNRPDFVDLYKEDYRLRARVRELAAGQPDYIAKATPARIRSLYEQPDAAPLLLIEDEQPDWLVFLDDDERSAYESRGPIASSAGPRREPREMSAAVRELLAAKEELAEFRSRPEYKEFRKETRPFEEQLRSNQRELRQVRRSSRPVNPDIWRLTVPSMGAVETLSLLSAIERSGVAEELAPVVQERIAQGRFQIPDILRAARGAALGSATPRAGFEDYSWAKKPKSFWEPVLDQVLDQRLVEKLPELPGRLLLLVDGSGSMTAEVSGRRNDARGEGYSSLSCAEVAAFAASAIASRCDTAPDVYVYDTDAVKVDVSGATGVLDSVRTVIGSIRGGGTDTERIMAEKYDGHDLVVVLTDEQTSWLPGQSRIARFGGYGSSGPVKQIPSGTKVVTVNLAGYSTSQGAGVRPGFVGISGWSEALFEAVADAVRPS